MVHDTSSPPTVPTTYSLVAPLVVDALRLVLPAAAPEEGLRPSLCAVHWEINRHALVLTAANGYVIAEATALRYPADDAPDCPGASALLPLLDMQILVTMLASVPYPAHVVITPGEPWRFVADRFTLACLPLTVSPPNYEKVWSGVNSPSGELTGTCGIDPKLLGLVMHHQPSHARLEIHNTVTPIRITARNYRALIMPMTIRGEL